MGTWILIVILVNTGNSTSPGGMSIPGFETRAACETAARASRTQVEMDINRRLNSSTLVSTTCVSTDGAVR